MATNPVWAFRTSTIGMLGLLACWHVGMLACWERQCLIVSLIAIRSAIGSRTSDDNQPQSTKISRLDPGLPYLTDLLHRKGPDPPTDKLEKVVLVLERAIGNPKSLRFHDYHNVKPSSES